MAYIAPNSTVEFFGDLGISPNYENTLYFSSVSAKDTYFSGLTKLATGTALSYMREQRGHFKIEIPMSTLINAGYIRFKNTSFENKWFYAFVKSVEYVNNVTTQVNFELDVMMTWMGVFSLGECYIERQHTINDGIGNNICNEGFSLGNYVTEGEYAYPPSEFVVIMYKTYNPDKDDASLDPTASVVQGTYIPIISYAYVLDPVVLTGLKRILDQLTQDNRIDEVIGMKIVPMEWVTSGSTVPHRQNNISIPKPYTNIGGSTYVPRNKKLFTYPFKYLEGDNCEGERVTYKYEYFGTIPDTTSSGNCTFDVFGSACTPDVNVMCVPLSYNHEAHAYDEAMSMKDFPSVAWNVDAYKAYIAQRDSTLFGNQIASVIGGAERGAMTGGMVGGIGGALLGGIMGAGQGLISSSSSLLADTLNEMRGNDVPTRMPHETKGTMSSNLMVQAGTKGFYFRMKSITENYARMIDDFFDLYGYAIRQKNTPNMNARPYWTYVKTKGCVVHGNLPADDGAKIENIFDSGIRFWKNHNHIGHYSSYNNAPL